MNRPIYDIYITKELNIPPHPDLVVYDLDKIDLEDLKFDDLEKVYLFSNIRAEESLQRVLETLKGGGRYILHLAQKGLIPTRYVFLSRNVYVEETDPHTEEPTGMFTNIRSKTDPSGLTFPRSIIEVSALGLFLDLLGGRNEKEFERI